MHEPSDQVEEPTTSTHVPIPQKWQGLIKGLWSAVTVFCLGLFIAGVPIRFNQAETMRIVDGKIVEWWVGFDRLWMSEQLGFELQPK